MEAGKDSLVCIRETKCKPQQVEKFTSIRY